MKQNGFNMTGQGGTDNPFIINIQSRFVFGILCSLYIIAASMASGQLNKIGRNLEQIEYKKQLNIIEDH